MKFCNSAPDAENYSLDVAQADEIVPTAVEAEPETAETANRFTTLISILQQ